jgi:hypothetical protein
MMNSVPDGILRLSHTEAPAEYLDFLTLANGGIFGGVIIYSVKAVGKMQDYGKHSGLAVAAAVLSDTG